MQINRVNLIIKPDSRRVLLRPLDLNSPHRDRKVVDRIASLPASAVKAELAQVLAQFKHRHRDLEQRLHQRFAEMSTKVEIDRELPRERQLLLGAYFAMEYSLEAAALFNGSLVWAPDQSDVPVGGKRFILSLRATGEGHISSIVFRTGLVDERGQISLDAASRYATGPSVTMPSAGESGIAFTFSPTTQLGERVIFPILSEERNGIEDARFVQLDDAGRSMYYATYTAYDGHAIRLRLLQTEDFLTFRAQTLQGREAQNKGMALFPRRIDGRYVMISRQDNENLFIMFSDDMLRWEQKQLLLAPAYPWEFIQIGNSGSPLATDAGWLVLTHAVGAMRSYTLAAILLDLEDPTRVIGRLQMPLLSPNEEERDGYVPNVVYSCGGQIHGGKLIIPYAMSDYASSFMTVELDQILHALRTK